MTPSPLLVVGSLAYDEIATPAAAGRELLGGSAAHFSAAAALTGSTPSILAVVGEDFRSEDLNRLRALPADVSRIERRRGRTFRWGGSYSADFSGRETLYTELGVFAGWRPGREPLAQSGALLFLANIHPSLQGEVLAIAGSRRFTALDTMNLWIDQNRDELAALLPRVDLLFINDEEARQLSGESSLIGAGKRLVAMGPAHCLLKKGEHGVLLFSGDEVFPFPSYPVETIIDSTGAGDAFAGGVMGHLSQEPAIDRDALRRALVTGSAAGSFAVEGLGLGGLLCRRPEDLKSRRAALLELMRTPGEGAFGGGPGSGADA